MIVKQLRIFWLIMYAAKCGANWELIICTVNECRNKFGLDFVLSLGEDRILYTASIWVLSIFRNLMHEADHWAVHLEQFGLLAQIRLAITFVLTTRDKCVRSAEVYGISECYISSLALLPFRYKQASVVQNLHFKEIEWSVEQLIEFCTTFLFIGLLLRAYNSRFNTVLRIVLRQNLFDWD